VSDHTEDELWGLLREAAGMPYGPARTALTEQVLSRVDGTGSDDLAFTTRMQATSAYFQGGEPMKSFVTFSWCVTEYDRDPTRYQRHTHNLLWHFKHMISAMRRFPEIPLDRTHAVLDDMERRFRAGGHSLHAVYAYRQSISAHVGDQAAADDWYQRWITAPRDQLSDCVGCDPTSRAHWLAAQGRDEDAIAIAEPVLGGRLTCVEQPQSILTTLLLPYARTGRHDAAADAHRRAYRALRSNAAELGQIAIHLQFLANTGNAARGLELVRRHLPWLDAAPSPGEAMDFAAAAALVLRRTREAAAEGTLANGPATASGLTVHRPAHRDRPAADVGIAELELTLHDEALAIAARFDARNGTQRQSQDVRAMLESQPLTESVTIESAVARRVRPTGATTLHTVAGPTEQPAAVPVEATVDDLLDLADDHWHCDRIDEAVAVAAEFDERFARAELTPLQRARRADLNGLVCANANDMEVAEISWTSAIDLYAAAGDDLRRQMARCRVGVLMCRTGRADVGLPIAEDATGHLAVHAPKHLLTAVHRRMALAYMFCGRADDALQSLDEASRYLDHDPYEYSAPKLAAERAGMLAEFGRLPEARGAAEAARDLCRARDYPAGIATSCWIIGRVAEMSDDDRTAVACYEEGLGHAEDDTLRRSLRRQRAILLSRTGRAAETIDDLRDEIEVTVAEDDSDSGLVARHALAVAYLNADRPLDAAEVAEDALTHLDGVDDPRAEIVRHVLAQAFRALREPDQALEQLSLVADSGRRRGSQALVGEMNEQMGDLLDGLDRDAEAAGRYAAAATAYTEAELPLEACRSRRRTAMSLMWADKIDPAVEALAAADLAALALPASDEVAWERAMLACEGARILAQRGDLDAALIRSANAPAQLSDLGDRKASRFAAGVLAHLLDRAERGQEANELRKLYGIAE
jgi:tetratricopeptide (TPR) repeat protein